MSNKTPVKSKTPMAISMRCPRCNKRAFDVSDWASKSLAIELKCPHCKSIVLIDLPISPIRAS